MSIYTEEALDKLNKKELITILLSLQSKVQSANNEILDQVCQLNQKFNQLVDMERQCWANTQYSRRECLEVEGIPDSVQNNELEDKRLTIFKKI